MALASEADAGGSITLILVCPEANERGVLRRRLEVVAARYRDMVELLVLRPDDVPAPYRRRGPLPGPALLVLRGGELVHEAMGAMLPARELDRVVRCAVEWPAV